ncbi:BPI1 domain-containing protein [Trichostrongylus colubriformis]|uniref:BPI1 domain-containing protein n=1 Tax=Trichostrongylus colubriformis TaxID=6319 RepID=A0AAN8IMS5_TRICO
MQISSFDVVDCCLFQAMRVFIVGALYSLLIVTAFNVKRKSDNDTDNENSLYGSMEKMIEHLENQVELHLGDEETREITTTNALEKTNISEYASGDITLRLYPSGMDYAIEKVMLAIRHDAMRHRPHTIRASYHGMDITVDSIQIVEFLVPKLEVERLGETKFRFFTHGGGMRYLGLYSTVYKTTREGQFEALVDDIRIQVDVEFSDEDNHVIVSEKKCSAGVGETLVQLIPSMPSQIVNLLSERIQHRFHEKVCPAFTHYVGEVANIVRSLASIEDVTTQKDELSLPCVIEHDRVATRIDSRGAKLSFKRTIPREKRSAISNAVVEPEIPVDEMASVSVTEDYINEMLCDLTESGSIIFHLHRIPAVQEVLRTQCDDRRCLGAFADLDRVTDGSGHLDSFVTSSPRVEFYNDQALVHISLNTVLSYENRAAHHRIPYLRFGTDMTMRLTKLNFGVSDDGYYRWTARYEIVELKTHDVHTDFEQLKGFSKHLEEHLNLHRANIEDLLTKHLNGDLPLRLNQHVHLQPDSAVFGHHRVIIPLNFKLDKKLLPAFQFVHTSFI